MSSWYETSSLIEKYVFHRTRNLMTLTRDSRSNIVRKKTFEFITDYQGNINARYIEFSNPGARVEILRWPSSDYIKPVALRTHFIDLHITKFNAG